jgi:hypothetical protein
MKVTITYGQQKFAPVQFHSFDVGPFSCEVEISDDMDANEECKQAYAFLRRQAEEAFKIQLQEFLPRVREAAAATRTR